MKRPVYIKVNNHFVKTIRNYYTFQPLKFYLQGVTLIRSSNVVQQNESPVVIFNNWLFILLNHVARMNHLYSLKMTR